MDISHYKLVRPFSDFKGCWVLFYMLFKLHYRPFICPCRIRVENALKTHVKRISFPTRISKIQSKPTIDTRWTAVQRSYLLTNQ